MPDPIIKLNNITKAYFSDEKAKDSPATFALKEINLEINSGEFVAIIGPSGSGKSTLMHIMGALDTPSSGQYFLAGQDISQLKDDDLAEIRNKKIGFVFQSFNLLARTTVLANVERPLIYAGIEAKTRIKRALDVLARVGLSEKINNLSNKLSGGETQRVAIARALVMNPDIILADEPTGNLDSKTSYDIARLLQEINRQGRTIVLITHEPDIAAYAQRIISLKDGEIISDNKITNKENS